MCGVCGCDQENKFTLMVKDKVELEHAHLGNLMDVEERILSNNEKLAGQNQKSFNDNGYIALNLISSPGSGKTSLLVKVISKLKNKIDTAVIEGDQQTNIDAKRIEDLQVPVVQVNTGKNCHLDAHQVQHAIEYLALSNGGLIFIENVGNLVCPALFNLGENCKVVMLSVTEGEDKPLKYPHIFHEAQALIINKIDLLPYVRFSVDKCIHYAHSINSKLKIFLTSAETEEGLNEFIDWINNFSLSNTNHSLLSNNEITSL